MSYLCADIRTAKVTVNYRAFVSFRRDLFMRQNWNVIAINDGVPPCWYKNCVKWLSECIHHSCSDVDDAFGLCAIARGSGTCTFTGAPTEYFTSSSGFTRNNINLIGKTGPVFFLRVFLLHSLWYCS
jgi:hypothetical protein